MSIDQYSQTPASNDLANYFQTGMAPSKVKNAGWDVMADMCQQLGPGSLVTSGGTANAQTITNTRQLGALYTGRVIEFYPGFTNTGAMTLQEDGLTAKNVFANGAALVAGMVTLNVIARCRYDGTQYQLLNPQDANGSFTITLTGMTATTTGTVNWRMDCGGKVVVITIASNITGTSNATTMTGTGIPASIAIGAASGARMILLGQDNGNSNAVLVTGLNGTTWTFTYSLAIAVFTGSGTKGLNASIGTYSA